MRPAIGYIRVSTAKQGRSGLGIEAQQEVRHATSGATARKGDLPSRSHRAERTHLPYAAPRAPRSTTPGTLLAEAPITSVPPIAAGHHVQSRHATGRHAPWPHRDR